MTEGHVFKCDRRPEFSLAVSHVEEGVRFEIKEHDRIVNTAVISAEAASVVSALALCVHPKTDIDSSVTLVSAISGERMRFEMYPEVLLVGVTPLIRSVFVPESDIPRFIAALRPVGG